MFDPKVTNELQITDSAEQTLPSPVRFTNQLPGGPDSGLVWAIVPFRSSIDGAGVKNINVSR